MIAHKWAPAEARKEWVAMSLKIQRRMSIGNIS